MCSSDLERDAAGDVAERIAAFVAVRRGVGQLADADAVHDDDDGAREASHSREVRKSSTASIVAEASPGPSNQLRVGSLRNQIN